MSIMKDHPVKCLNVKIINERVPFTILTTLLEPNKYFDFG